MKIGIDCRTILSPQIGELAGVAHYTYYLVKNLLEIDSKNKYVLFFDSRFKNVDEFLKYKNVTIKFFPFYKYKKFLPLIYSQWIILNVIKKEKLDIFHAPANIMPLGYKGKTILTIHDLGVYKFPDFFPNKVFGSQSYSKKVLVPKSVAKKKNNCSFKKY